MEVFVLTTVINGRKNFVANFMSNRADNKKIVNYTINPGDAKDFESIGNAEAFIPRIVNPHERIFTAETIDVPADQITAGALTEENIK